MHDWLFDFAHRWLEKHVPGGTLHALVVQVFDAALKIVAAVLLFLVLRWIGLRMLSSIMVPILTRTTGSSEAHKARIRTLENLARKVLTYTIFFFTLISLLGQLGLDVTTILTGAGVFGLALSFGAQRLVRDALAGVFLLTEDQFHLGEFVTLVGGPGLPQITGTVLDMGLRATRLQDIAGRIVTIGNGDIAIVVNQTRAVAVTADVGVANDTALDKLGDVVSKLTLDAALFSGPAKVDAVVGVDATRTLIRVAAPTKLGMAPLADSALRRSLGAGLAQAGVALR